MKTVIPASPHRRLLLLLGISLLVHLVFLSLNNTLKIELGNQPPSMSVSLDAVTVTKSRTQQKNIQSPAPQKKPSIADSQLTRKHQQKLPLKPLQSKSGRMVSSDQSRQPPVVRSEAADSNTPALNRARIVARLREDLSQYFYYPPLARRNGLQGTVLISFGISGEGTVHDIHIVKSSGYAILDLAAQDAMQRLDKLSWYAALMHGKDMDLELPVIFRLTEG